MRQELRRLDPGDRVHDQLPELLPLFVGDGSTEVLDFDQPFADEDHLGDFGDAGHPGIADQLGVEGQESIRFFRVAAGGGLPLDQALGIVDFANGIDISDEVVVVGDRTFELDLQVLTGLADTDAIILAETIEQRDALLQHAIPAVTVRVVQCLILVGSPFPEQNPGSVFLSEVSAQSLFEGPTEEHGGTSVFLLPAIQIPMSVTTRAREVLADLGVAVGHGSTWELSRFEAPLAVLPNADSH